jgi:F-type H+-transporting ATPase subunit gamma
MANVRDIRNRIRTVKNIQQITRAMKMVAAGRLRRAQENVFNARPFAQQMLTILSSVAARTEPAAGGAPGPDGVPAHPLLVQRPVEKVLLVLITADRGLCGAFNANLLRAAQNYLAKHSAPQVSLLAVGRKGRDFFRRRPVKLVGAHTDLFGRLKFSHAQAIAGEIIDLHTRAEVDAVDLMYNEFKSVLVQRLTVERHLPIRPFQPPPGSVLIDYIYEQPPAEIFRALLPRYVEIQVYRALLESQAAELSARMTAMDAATNNAAELIDTFTLHMNRVRQAAITKEIIEIISGAAAI